MRAWVREFRKKFPDYRGTFYSAHEIPGTRSADYVAIILTSSRSDHYESHIDAIHTEDGRWLVGSVVKMI